MRHASHPALNGFLAGIERRALRFAQLATGDSDEALDLVQDSMIALARHYAERDPDEWPPLFHRILDNRIRRWRFRQLVTRRWLGLRHSLSEEAAADEAAQPLPAQLTTDSQEAPDQQLLAAERLAAVQAALRRLPDRQRQAFLLRQWERLSTEDTAKAMGCSSGSVKTHLSRAIENLRSQMLPLELSP